MTAKKKHKHHDYRHDICSTTAIRDFVTVVALSFHAIFEGLAIGLETESGDVWQLCAG